MSAAGIWLLEDLEPWPDAPAIGSVFAPTTYWVNRGSGKLPPEVCSEHEAWVESHTSDDRVEWTADLGHGFTTMLRPDQQPGRRTLNGCLMWDHYLWLDYRTKPTGYVRLLDRPGHIIQRRHLTPTAHPGRFSVSFDGPHLYCESGIVPEGFWIRWNVLLVEPVPDGGRRASSR